MQKWTTENANSFSYKSLTIICFNWQKSNDTPFFMCFRNALYVSWSHERVRWRRAGSAGTHVSHQWRQCCGLCWRQYISYWIRVCNFLYIDILHFFLKTYWLARIICTLNSCTYVIIKLIVKPTEKRFCSYSKIFGCS